MAAKLHLMWDPAKNTQITFTLNKKPITSCNTLGIHLRSDLSFREHIRRRTAKETTLLKVMTRLGNSNGCMSPRALRALYTGAIRPIFTWGSELWNRPKRVEYQALRKITGAYHGSSHETLLAISHIEPLQTKLDDITACWAARSLRTGDPHLRQILDTPPPNDPTITCWHDGRGGPSTRQRAHP